MSEHRQEFDNELEAIESKVIELFAMVAEGLPAATQALLNGDDDAYPLLAERDQAIDALYLEVEGLANREILLQAPVASDLRFLLSVLRIVPELERSHDLVVHIAAAASHFLGDDLTPRAKALVERMGDLAADMWRQGGRLVVPARPDRRGGPRRARRGHGRAARQPHRRARRPGRWRSPSRWRWPWSRGTTSGSARTRSTSPAACVYLAGSAPHKPRRQVNSRTGAAGRVSRTRSA